MRRTLQTGIVVLAATECLIWFVTSAITIIFSGFSLGPPDPQVVAEREREGFIEFAWFALNAVGLFTFALQTWGRRLLAAIQSANAVVTLWLGFGQLTHSCGQGSPLWFALAGIAILTLLLQYILWRRVDHTRPNTPVPAVDRRVARIWTALVEKRKVGPIPVIVWLAAGAALVGAGVLLGLPGIASYSGAVRSADVQSDGLHVTIDSTSREFFFSNYRNQLPPRLTVGEKVVILTAESCGYGEPAAVQSQGGMLWIAYSSAADIPPFTPDTWPVHELLRWLALSAGVASTLIGVFYLLRWIG